MGNNENSQQKARDLKGGSKVNELRNTLEYDRYL